MCASFISLSFSFLRSFLRHPVDSHRQSRTKRTDKGLGNIQIAMISVDIKRSEFERSRSVEEKKMLKSASKVTVINFLGATLELTQFPAGAIFCGTFLRQLNGRAERKVGTSTTLESLPAGSRFTVYAGSRKRWNKARAESGTSEVELEQSSLMVINVRRSQCNSRRKKRARSSRKRLEDSASTIDACVCARIYSALSWKGVGAYRKRRY